MPQYYRKSQREGERGRGDERDREKERECVSDREKEACRGPVGYELSAWLGLC